MTDSVEILADSENPGAYVLKTDLWLPQPLEEVFEFFADASNLEAITPPWLCFRIVTPQPIEMRAGALIDYRLRLHGIPLGWKTEIAAWAPPHFFVDRQLRGPYRQWIHEHTFTSVDGGTRIQDRVRYRIFCGTLVHGPFVRGDLQKIFEYRQKMVRKHFGQTAAANPQSG